MKDTQQISKVEHVEATSLASELQKVPVFAGATLEDLRCLGTVEPVSYTHLDVYKRQALTLGSTRVLHSAMERESVSHPR